MRGLLRIKEGLLKWGGGADTAGPGWGEMGVGIYGMLSPPVSNGGDTLLKQWGEEGNQPPPAVTGRDPKKWGEKTTPKRGVGSSPSLRGIKPPQSGGASTKGVSSLNIGVQLPL